MDMAGTPSHPAVCIAVAGEALVDLIQRSDGTFDACLGGAPYNLARALARQGVGTVYLNPLSADRFGLQLARQLHDDGVQLARQQPASQTTALALVAPNDSGHPEYAFYREGVADRQVCADSLSQDCALQPDLQIVCTGALALDARDASLYLPWLRTQRAAGHCLVVDANLRPSVMPDLQAYRANVRAALLEADIIKLSDEDLRYLGLHDEDVSALLDHATAMLAQSRASMLLLTLGEQGAWLMTRQARFYAREATPLAVVDTVGAGDCFLAGLLAALLTSAPATGLLSGMDADRCQRLLRHALACASLCVQRRGCVPPDWDAALAWSQAHPVFTQA